MLQEYCNPSPGKALFSHAVYWNSIYFRTIFATFLRDFCTIKNKNLPSIFERLFLERRNRAINRTWIRNNALHLGHWERDYGKESYNLPSFYHLKILLPTRHLLDWIKLLKNQTKCIPNNLPILKWMALSLKNLELHSSLKFINFNYFKAIKINVRTEIFCSKKSVITWHLSLILWCLN